MFKPRGYDPDRPNRQTDAQKAATQRNFSIFQLRGLWMQAFMLNEPMRTTVRHLIDIDLIGRGALPQAEHERARDAKHMAAYAKRNGLTDDDLDLPF